MESLDAYEGSTLPTSAKDIRPGSPAEPQDTGLDVGTVGRSGITEIHPGTSKSALEAAQSIARANPRRQGTPVRSSYIRNDIDNVDSTPPLMQLASTRGRGGDVAIKLHLAVLWRAAAEPFDISKVSARQWAQVLDLPDPANNGRRRIAAALKRLSEVGLIRLEYHRGDPSDIYLLNESGNGAAYTLPYEDMRRKKSKNGPTQQAGHYFRIPNELWTEGHLQHMSAAAIVMLLALLSEAQGDPNRDIWWSTRRFAERFSISSNMRARGTKELVGRRLLIVTRKLVSSPSQPLFANDRKRNTYQLINAARPLAGAVTRS